MLEVMLEALQQLLRPEHLLHMFYGVLLGLSVGVFPGLGGIAGLSLVLPFIFGMDTASALGMLIGLVAVIPTSDTFTSVMMGIPGSSSAQATVLDGFPLAKQGQAARALSAAFSASLLGGLIGAIVLSGFVLIARPLILSFSSAELFMLAVLGLSMVGVLSGGSLLKGVAACGLGLVLGTIGGAPATGEFRLTMGLTNYLIDGVPLVVVGLALFAVPEIVDLLRQERSIGGDAAGSSNRMGAGWLAGLGDMGRNFPLYLRCAGLGSVIGAIPGLGGSVVDWITYGHVVQSTRDKSNFGNGEIRGVLGPESSNNAKEGGGLMPTLLFGIPGSGSMAIFLGGMMLLGIEPGPSMVTTELDLTYTIIWSLALANVLGAGLCLGLAKPISLLTTIRFSLLAPFMFMVISFAAFQGTRSLYDLLALFVVGLLGIFLKRFGWPRPAFLIGFVLAAQAETYLYQAIQFHGWSFLWRPGVLIIAGVTIGSAWLGSRSAIGEGPVSDEQKRRQELPEPAQRWPQLVFTLALLAFAVYALIDSLSHSFLGSVFPASVSGVLIVALMFLVHGQLRGAAGHTSHYDQELAEPYNGLGTRGLWENIGWFSGLLVGSAIIGFFSAIVLFFLIFLPVKARLRWPSTILLTAAAAGFLIVLGNLLMLRYPPGLLPELLNLPWPLGS